MWEATLDTMKGYSVTSENKHDGTIETTWIEMEGKKRPYGIFAREGFGNRERARLTVVVKQDQHRSTVNVLERGNAGMPEAAYRNKPHDGGRSNHRKK